MATARDDRSVGKKESFFIIKPEEGGFLDLYRLFRSDNILESRFVDSPADLSPTEIASRWLIFVSILVQKILLLLKEPMAWFGGTLEFVLNLLEENDGLFALLINFFKGKVVAPDKESSSYRSFVGFTDGRTELRMSESFGEGMEHAYLSIMAAKLAYESEAYIHEVVVSKWKMEFVEFFGCWNEHQQRKSTQAFIFQTGNGAENLIVVAFRGTEPFDAYQWCTDFDFSWYEVPPLGKVHCGFLRALGVDPAHLDNPAASDAIAHPLAYYAIRDRLMALMKYNEKARFIVTGHSLGGALATLFPSLLVLCKEEYLMGRLAGVYTFGQPRVGDRRFADRMGMVLLEPRPRYYRFVYENDIVPRIPYDDATMQFKHFGVCVYYNSFYEGKMMREEPNKNYFSLKSVIPKYGNAMWELTRGLMIGFWEGKEYREGWFELMLRVSALVVPGFTPHGPRDYVNSTRLGPIHLEKQKIA